MTVAVTRAVLWSNELMMVFRGSADGKQDYAGQYRSLLPRLLKMPPDEVEFYFASWTAPPVFLVPIGREFMDAMMTGDSKRAVALLVAAMRESSDNMAVEAGFMQAVITRPDSRPGSTCPRCGRRSPHPDDIANRYCGHCLDVTDGVVDQGRGVPA